MRCVSLVLCLLASNLGAIPIEAIPPLLKEHNQDIKAAEQDVEAAKAQKRGMFFKHFPSLSIRNSFIHLGSPIEIALPNANLPLGNIGTLSLSLPPIHIDKQDAFFSSAWLTMPIFAGGRISAGVSAMEAQEREASATQSKVEEEKLQEALTRYFQVKLAQEVLKVLRTVDENLSRIQTISEGLVKSGLAAKFFTIQIKVAKAELKARLAEATGKSNLADLAFKNAIGKDGFEALAYESTLKKLKLPTSSEPFKEAALKYRSEFSVLEAKREQAQALKAVKTGEMLPTVYGFGAARLHTENSALINPHWAVGLVLEIPLTSWLESLPERQRAQHLEQKVDILKVKANREIPLQIEKLYSELVALDASLKAYAEAESMSKEALRIAEIRFKGGDSSALEVLRASTDLEKSEIQRLQALEEYNRKLIELHSGAGSTVKYLDSYKVSEG